ncbi:hypothetical protein DI09_19p260 [Mitosporidium daphniae]|uniref:Uncharacterized protein n=1 Tax=Mitosporidium daphniae TaxID=1485682 RepID=A0A098VTT3_9MICR|nr:uncharacterized protein DI09_19p260 [Mitosporidium daphniae]KGG52244.1 hypothetical protein DI09_19p260 [Mitosporidium daphniae]|eukprot:XP_013238671.1 uncharacterized protein DI09_19p260 [Mitosporidium daphniae]
MNFSLADQKWFRFSPIATRFFIEVLLLRMPKHLASFKADEDGQTPSYGVKAESQIEETPLKDDSTILQYWAAIIILSIFATIAFAVILSTWKKLRPFSSFTSPQSSNSHSNSATARDATERNNAYRSNPEIVKSEPIASGEFASL